MVNKVRVTLDVILQARAPPAPKRQGTHFGQQQLPAQQGSSHLCEPVAMRWKTPSPHKERSSPLGYFKTPQSSAGQTRDILEHGGREGKGNAGALSGSPRRGRDSPGNTAQGAVQCGCGFRTLHFKILFGGLVSAKI